MLSEKVKSRIRLRLRDTHLRQLIAREIVGLLAEKPEEIAAEEYCHVVADLVVSELRERLCGPFEGQPPPPETAEAVVSTEVVSASQFLGADSSRNLDSIVHHLTAGVEHALLAGNLEMLRALGEAIAQRDSGTSKHSPRVTLYSLCLAETMGLGTAQIQALIKGSFLHDIGKIGIRDEIILKPSGLSNEERLVMNSHPQLGSMIISSVKWLEDARDVVRHHHERFDGSGYPDGLKGEQIPLNARIFAVVDVFDAVTSDRPYKAAQPFNEAMALIRSKSGSHFDPQVLAAFESIARRVYDEYAFEPYHVLDEKLRRAIQTHFGLPEPLAL